MQKQVVSLLAGMLFVMGLVVTDQLSAIAAEPVQLTVIGKIENSNRSRFEEFSDAFFKFRGKEFTKAFEFTYAGLAALSQVTVNARAEKWPAAITATGPNLEEVMKAAGAAPDAKLSLVALDGYTIELEAAERNARNWILRFHPMASRLELEVVLRFGFYMTQAGRPSIPMLKGDGSGRCS